jgi:hypothetical protein
MSFHLLNNNNNNSNENLFKSNEHELREKIYELKDRIIQLETENKNNLIRISELTKTKNILIEMEKSNEALTSELLIKEEEIKSLKDELINEKKLKNMEQRILENNFDLKLMYYKRIQDAHECKENAASSILKLNEVQHYSIIQLENKIEKIKNIYENKLKEKEISYDKKYTNLKKEMMDFLKNAQKNMAKTSKENLELNTKLGILYKNQMLNELETQSHMIEKLIKEKEEQNKEIFLLKQELIVHKKVEEMIKKSNYKFVNAINKIKRKINNKKIKILKEDNKDEENKESNEITLKSENNIYIKKIANLKKRAKSVKYHTIKVKENLVERNSGILQKNFDRENNSELINKKMSNRTNHKMIKKFSDKEIKNDKDNKIKFEENKGIQTYLYENSISINPELNNIINEIINLSNNALDLIIKDIKYKEYFNDASLLNEFDLKSDYYKLNDKLKRELLFELIIKILNNLKINYNNIIEKNDNIFEKTKGSYELLKINDEYNLKYSKLLDDKNYDNIKKLNKTNKKLRYDKLINILQLQKTKNKYLFTNKLFSFKIKKNKYINKNSLINIKKNNNKLSNTFRGKTPNLLNRYIHITKNKYEKNDNTFFDNFI